MADIWFQQMHPEWAAALAEVGPELRAATARVARERTRGASILPAAEHVLRAFRQPLSGVRVLVVGQDPYPTAGDAVGLSFSVAPTRAMPRSLRNIAAELASDTGEVLVTGDLSHWAAQGVMLLNRVLTVEEGTAGSHRDIGWEAVTDAAVSALTQRGGPLVAVLWGRQAQSLAPLLGDVDRIESAHPSPLSAHRGFVGSRPFSRVNASLRRQGAEEIVWGSPAPTG